MKRRPERGAAVVEMAFAVMLLVWLVLGIVDMGRAIYTNIALQDAVQAGVAHAAFTKEVDPASVEAAITSSTESIDLTDAIIEAYCDDVVRTDQNAGRVKVTVSYDLDYITPVVGPALGGTLNLSKTAEAERFFESCDGLPGE